MTEKRTLPQDDVRMPVPRPRQEDAARLEPSNASYNASYQDRVPKHSFTVPQEAMADWWQILRRRKTSVLIAVLAFGVLGVVFSKLQTPIYESHASLEYLPPGELPAALRDGTGGPDGSDAALEASMQTYVSLLQGDATLSQVIAKLKLDQRSDYLRDAASPLWARLQSSTPETPAQRALKIAARDLGVRPQARLIQLSYESANPKLAADFLNTLMDQFLIENSAKRQKAAQRQADLLYDQAAQLRAKLDATDRRLQAEIRNLGGDSGAGKQSSAENRLNELSGELARAEADRIQKESLKDIVSSAPPESIAEAASDTPAREYLTKLTDLRRQLAEQSAILTPAHYKVRQIQDQITVLETALKNELGRVRARVDNDYRSAEERERMLSDDYLRQSRSASDVAARSVSLDLLRHQSEADWTAYAAAFQKARELSLGAITPANDIRIVDNAEPPSRPFRPNVPLNVSVALFGGLLVGLVQAAFRDRRDVRLRTSAEAADLLGFHELAAVPYAGRGNGLLLHVDSRVRPALAGNHQVVRWAGRTPDLMMDSFRQAAASLCLRHDIRSRVIVVTSPGPGEGKTTVVSNLAATLALLGNRVLLVDGDLRRPRLHEVFNLPNGVGLSGLLSASGQAVDGFARDTQEREEIQSTEIPGLFVLASGSSGPSAADAGAGIVNLLCSPRIRSLIRRLRHDFDIVLIDTPPALLGADARLLARLSDGVVMVLRSGETRPDAALAALDRLSQDRANVLGYVLNGLDTKADHGYYSGMYRHYRAS